MVAQSLLTTGSLLLLIAPRNSINICKNNTDTSIPYFNRPVEDTVVRAGSAFHAEGGITAKVLEVITHADYNSISSYNDIKLLKLDRPITGKGGGRIINMIGQGQETAVETVARVSGWGQVTFENKNNSEVLRTVEVDIIDHATCAAAYWYLTSGMICASRLNKDSCISDSGGPLAIDDNLLIGVVSFGYECARESHPGVYAKVSNYRNWIHDNSGV